jgi:hypothetical protein
VTTTCSAFHSGAAPVWLSTAASTAREARTSPVLTSATVPLVDWPGRSFSPRKIASPALEFVIRSAPLAPASASAGRRRPGRAARR